MGKTVGQAYLPYLAQKNESSSGSSTESSSSASYKKELVNNNAPTSCSVIARYALQAATAQAKNEKVATPPFQIRLTRNCINIPIAPGSVLFTWGGDEFYDVRGSIYANMDPATGVGVLRGSINYLTGVVTLDAYDAGANTVVVQSLAGRLGSQYVTEVNFRTAGAPLRSASFTISGVTMHGEQFAAQSNENGDVSGEWLTGFVDAATGIVTVGFGKLVANTPEVTTEEWYNEALVTEDGTQVWKPEPVYADSLTYACVVYSYIPLDAELLGINPVRLPVDGRVPLVKPGDAVVVHNTASMVHAGSVAGGTVITLPRTASSVELYDSADPPLRIPATMYDFAEESNTLTISTTDNDFGGYTLPLVIVHKIEDQVLVSRTQINGQIGLSRGLTHDYPVEGTRVSSALLFGDLQSRAFGVFDQKTWTSDFADDVIGDAANATFNSIDYPVEVTNAGAVDDRWALVFDSAEHFNIVAEQRGIVGDGYITQDCEPVNGATNAPYFFIDHRGWGTGWRAGNVLRFNTRSSTGPVWAVRTTLQGPEQEPEDFFTIQPRGDAA